LVRIVRFRRWVVGLGAVLVAGTVLGTTPSDMGAVLGYGAFTRSELRSLIEEISIEMGLDPALIDALVRVESGYNPRAVSPKGAMGLMQLMPSTARRLAVDDPFDPVQNIRGGVRELSRLVDRYSGNLGLALAAYNAGEGAVEKYSGIPPYRETRSYVARIMRMYTGRPYTGFGTGPQRAPVRLVKDNRSGEVLITNVGGSQAASAPVAPGVRGALGGGFGR
jgi:hypothetical protein